MASDPGRPAPGRARVKIFTPAADRDACAAGCRTAGIGCLDCKDVLLKHMLPPLAAIRERRQVFAEKPARIVEPTGRRVDRDRWRAAVERARAWVPELSALDF